MKDNAELRLHRAIRALPPRPVCRDCADHDGTCQSNGKEPCDPYDALPMRIRELVAERDRHALKLLELISAAAPLTERVAAVTAERDALRAEVERLQAEVDKLRNRHVPDSSCLSCGGPLQVCATFGLCCPCMPHEGHTTP